MQSLSPHVHDLFLSNSMPVRDADSFLYNAPNLGAVGVNRGASGIDGIISSAVGFALASPETKDSPPLTAVIGDVAMTHDIGGLKVLAESRRPVVVVLVNNDGGQIFNFLPIAKHGESVGFEEFWTTRTSSLDFSKIVSGFGVDHVKVDTYGDLSREYSKAMSGRKSIVIEAVVPSDNVKAHRDITKSLIPRPLPAKIQYSRRYSGPSKTVLLLHGFMGSCADFDSTVSDLRESLPDTRFVSVTLPGHFPDDNRLSYDLKSMASAVWSATPNVDTVIGYSMGGRVAMEMKRQHPEINVAVLGGATERKHQGESAAATTIGDFEEFVDRWYSAEIWGGIKDRECFEPIRKKRIALLRSIGSDFAERVLRESGNRIDYALSPTDLYVAGELDSKYMKVLDSVAAKTATVPRVGHAVLEEAPSEVAARLTSWLNEIGGESASLGGAVQLNRLSFEASPLNPEATEKFARGDLANRTSFTIKLGSTTDGAQGIGEAAPLNKLHPETAEDLERALSELSSSLSNGGLLVPLEVLDFSTGALNRVINEMEAKAGLDLDTLPSLRAALESAIMMMVGGEDFVGMTSAKNGGTMRNEVRYNGLVSQDGSSFRGGGTVKVKVGSLEDAARVDEITGRHEVVRLDANGQMEWEKSVLFGRSIEDKAKIEYVEEPLNFVEGTPLGLRLESLSDWSKLTGLRYALDESLAFGDLEGIDELEGCSAVVLKPTLIGFDKSWRIARRAKELGVDVVITSCFDGGVGLAHLTWFAALLDGGEGVHGLSTFDRYSEGTMQGFLESVVLINGKLSVNGAKDYLMGLRAT